MCGPSCEPLRRTSLNCTIRQRTAGLHSLDFPSMHEGTWAIAYSCDRARCCFATPTDEHVCLTHSPRCRLMVMDAGVARRLSRGFPLVVVHNLSKRPPKAGTGFLFQKDVHRDTVGSLGSSCVWLGITSQRIPCVDCVGVRSMLLFAYARLEYNCKGTHNRLISFRR